MNEEEFFNKYIMQNPINFKEGIIAHCRTLDKYDVYEWVANNELKIKQLLEENQQLKQKLEQRDNIINKAREKIKKSEYAIDFETNGFSLTDYDINEILEILNIDKGE